MDKVDLPEVAPIYKSQLYSVKEVSDHSKLKPKSIYDLIGRGVIKCIRIGSGVYIPYSQIKAIVKRPYRGKRYGQAKITQAELEEAKKILSIPEAAKKLKCSREHIYKLIKKGDLHPISNLDNTNERTITLSEINNYKNDTSSCKRKSCLKRHLLKPHTPTPPGWTPTEDYEAAISYTHELLSTLSKKGFKELSDTLFYKQLARDRIYPPLLSKQDLTEQANKVLDADFIDEKGKFFLVGTIKHLFGIKLDYDIKEDDNAMKVSNYKNNASDIDLNFGRVYENDAKNSTGETKRGFRIRKDKKPVIKKWR